MLQHFISSKYPLSCHWFSLPVCYVRSFSWYNDPLIKLIMQHNYPACQLLRAFPPNKCFMSTAATSNTITHFSTRAPNTVSNTPPHPTRLFPAASLPSPTLHFPSKWSSYQHHMVRWPWLRLGVLVSCLIKPFKTVRMILLNADTGQNMLFNRLCIIKDFRDQHIVVSIKWNLFILCDNCNMHLSFSNKPLVEVMGADSIHSCCLLNGQV